MANINESIFREYDIRGRESEEELNTSSLELIGRAYGTYLTRRGIETVIVGNDSRATSEDFREAAIEGLLSTGRKVINIGTVMTPMMSWAQFHFNTEGGIMITASHNPKGWNGAKLADGFASTLGGEELKELYKMIKNDDFDTVVGGELKKEDIKKEYIEDLISRVDVKKEFRVVVSTGNGTAGLFAPDLFNALGCKVIERHTEPDANFPNYTPNPADTEMMEDTGGIVLENEADFGLAFDGDGDRLGLTDEEGNVVWPDKFAIFLARLVLKNKPGAKIIYDVKSSRALAEDIEAHGGEPIMAPTGHSNIKRVMKEKGAELGAELSGHIFVKDNYYGFDDASMAAVSLIQYFSEQDKAVSRLVAETPQYVSSPGYTAATPDDKKFQVVKEMTEEFKNEGYKVVDIDGARVNFKELEGWGLVRVSNTGPNITLRFEAKTKDNLKKIEDIFREKLSRYDFVSKEWVAG
ncbi:MAG: phosphomannomutase/phosphoglucomutase [Candidatus Spechtbacterales bacterium]|nr:phosphomannomutase/phosphoglucomutase [Candidatus Spechtbacterales bacterium]